MHYIKYKEIKTRGTAGFPIGYYHVNHVHPQYAMPYHWHEELEFIHIIEGSFTITINETMRTALPGDLFIVNGGFLHGGIPNHCVYECLVFPCEILLGKSYISLFLDLLNMQDIILHEYYPAHSDSYVPKLILEIFQLIKNSNIQNQLLIIGLLIQTFGYIYSENHYTFQEKLQISQHKNIYLLKNVLAYIEENYSNTITLNDLAKIAGMSSKYFCRFFFEMTGRTPIDYVNYYRIERACYQLVNFQSSITEVSLSCGFHDISYFIRIFKKYKGKSPRQYLKDLV